MTKKNHTFPEEQLNRFCISVFDAMGCPATDAITATNVLLAADLRGIDSHGVARLSGYVRLWEAGRINTKPNIRLVHSTASTGTVDGDAGLGLVVAPKAMQIALEKSDAAGSGWISVTNSNHFGIAAAHAMLASAQDKIGIAMTNASPLVAPTFSVERMLGTNPMCFAIPAKKHPAVVADMATSAAANGKLEIAQREGKAIPQGWLQTHAGDPSVDAHEAKNGGALLPLGSNRDGGSHKGYAFASVVDIFSGVLSGANYGPWVPPFVSFLPLLPDMPGKGLGHFLGAMRVDGFRPLEEYYTHIDRWIARFKSAKTAEGYEKVIIPGEPETAHALYRTTHGIPLFESVVNDLEEVGKKFAITL